ncbi:hypothetical protein L9F63_014528, partial [Diploptera punctata]
YLKFLTSNSLYSLCVVLILTPFGAQETRANRLKGGHRPAIRGPSCPYRTPAFSVLYSGGLVEQIASMEVVEGTALPFGAQVVPTALPLFPFCILADSSSKSPQWRWCCSLLPSGPKKTRAN